MTFETDFQAHAVAAADALRAVGYDVSKLPREMRAEVRKALRLARIELLH